MTALHRFDCPSCGYRYADSGNFTSCLRCGGFGRPEKGCLCPHFRTLAGPTRARSGTNPACPLHGETPAVEAIA